MEATFSTSESKEDSGAGNWDQWVKMAKEAKSFSDKAGDKVDDSQEEQTLDSEDERTILEPRTWDIEDINKRMQDNLKRDLALYDKYDYERLSEEDFDKLLEGESTPSPVTDSESLIENVIWVNQRKLERTDLSENDRRNIKSKIEEAEMAKILFEEGTERKAEIEREIAYYDLPISEQTQDRWANIHGLMSEQEKHAACFESPTYESATEFVKEIINQIDTHTLDKIIEVKKTGNKQALIEEITTELAFMAQYDNQRPAVEYVDSEDPNEDACHNYLGYGIDKISIDKKLLTDAYDMDYIVMTVGHEMLHAYQNTLMRNADKTDKKAQAYRYNLEHYVEAKSLEDYQKYHDQLVEIEAFCFGEQFRELVKAREQYLYGQDEPKKSTLLAKLRKLLDRKA